MELTEISQLRLKAVKKLKRNVGNAKRNVCRLEEDLNGYTM